ncbi:MAG TPA: response regulator transcription factor [Candidatus Acidoferrales bacterium]|nr:response regulator transcription factor [Candidatus Acidoferrales bacterium]
MAKGKARDSIRVLVADDHTIFREGLCRLLEAENDITVIGEARSGTECVSLVGKLKPDVLLLDLKMPDQDGLAVLSELGGAESPVRTIVLTASEDERDYVETVRRGARGIVLKQAATERLLEGIRKVHRGEIWIDQRVAAEVVKAMSRPAAAPTARGEKGLLTPREGEIVSLVTQGFRNKEIADKLSISEQTVKNHLQNIYDKLGVSDRLELALYALHHKLAQPG